MGTEHIKIVRVLKICISRSVVYVQKRELNYAYNNFGDFLRDISIVLPYHENAEMKMDRTKKIRYSAVETALYGTFLYYRR